MELLIMFGLGVVFVFIVGRVIVGGEQRRKRDAIARGAAVEQTPASLAELRMWEKHYGLAAMRGLTVEQRKAEIVALRTRDGV